MMGLLTGGLLATGVNPNCFNLMLEGMNVPGCTHDDRPCAGPPEAASKPLNAQPIDEEPAAVLLHSADAGQ